MKQRAAKIPPQAKDLRLREAVERLVHLYEATDKKDEAAKWRKELEAQKSKDKISKPPPGQKLAEWQSEDRSMESITFQTIVSNECVSASRQGKP